MKILCLSASMSCTKSGEEEILSNSGLKMIVKMTILKEGNTIKWLNKT